jgi:hypothetical protein
MMRQKYPVQLDCVWVASDRNGHVAAFVTAGVGPIPEPVLDNTEPPFVEDIERSILELPTVSSGRLLISVSRPDSFVKIAERGFFVYDWSDVHRTTASWIDAYEPMASPLTPMLVGALPEMLRSIAVRVQFSAAAFNDGKNLNVKDYFECCSAM